MPACGLLKDYLKKSNSLIIANSKYHPVELLRNLWKFLQKSGAFVIYHRFLQPLVEAETFIKDNKIGLYMHLEELWLREYQVLKDRSHPKMQNEHAASGYLLYGYKVGEF